MLIGSFVVISLAVAAGICFAVDAFAGLMWLWLLPVCTVGIFLVLAAAWFAMLLVMAKAVDMEKDREKDSPFYRSVVNVTIAALVPLLRIRIRVQGKELIPKDGRFLLVCNHLHEADPIVLLWVFRKSQLAFISKRENDSRFLIGPFLRAILCQPINRENDREALKTILKCIRLIKEDTVSIAVFPEGYTSMDRLLHPFRSGVFKIAQKADVPIVVCTLRNTYDIYHNIKHGKGMEVEVHITGVIPAEDLKGRTAVDVANQAHEMMAKDLGPDLVLPQEENTKNA